jgi:hypothetical protein
VVPDNPIPSRRPEDVTEGQVGVEQIAMRGSKEAEFRATCIRLCRLNPPEIAALLGARSMFWMRSLTTEARAFSAKGQHSESCDPPML